MDYKEKYEMALESIQEILDSGEDSIKMSRLQLRLQGIFPELRESEDERIRKALLGYFNEQCDMSDWNGVYGYQVVAWLEKQGEQNTIEPQKQYAKDEENIINDIEQCIEQCGDSFMPSNGTSSANMLAWLEKQKQR